MRRLALVALAVLTPAWAFAQAATTGLTIRLAADPSTDEYTFNASACRETLTAEWKYVPSTGAMCTVLSLWATEGECGDAPATGDVRYDDVPQLTVQTAGQGTWPVKIAELPAFRQGSATPCGTDGLAKTHRLCGAVSMTTYDCNSGTRNVLRASPLKLTHDTKPPAVPVITAVEAQDGAAGVTFTVDTDAETVVVEAKGPTDADYVTRGDAAASAGTVRATKLVNGNTYDVRLKAVDGAGNVSEPTEPWAVTPIRTVGFWGVYRQKGGSDPGGCAAAGGGPAALWALWLLSRRRTR